MAIAHDHHQPRLLHKLDPPIFFQTHGDVDRWILYVMYSMSVILTGDRVHVCGARKGPSITQIMCFQTLPRIV